jgi:hypothetical protein
MKTAFGEEVLGCIKDLLYALRPLLSLAATGPIF